MPYKTQGPGLAWHITTATLVAAAIASGATMAMFDLAWTIDLRHGPGLDFARFMDQSLLRRTHQFGGADIPQFLMIGVALAYMASYIPNAPAWLVRLRPYAGIATVLTVFLTLFVVHGTKFGWGRARPYLVLPADASYPFSDWFRPGPLNPANGRYSGAFPSGHTSAVMLPMILAYLRGLGPQRTGFQRFQGLLLAVVVLDWAILMVAARAIAGQHWVADGLLVLAADWLVVHLALVFLMRYPWLDDAAVRTTVTAPWVLHCLLWTGIAATSWACLLVEYRAWQLDFVWAGKGWALLAIVPLWAGLRQLQLRFQAAST